MRVAQLTLDAIETAIEADQGAKYRGLLRELMPLAEDAYNPEEDGRRKHLGASLLGRECPRELWYVYRWASQKRFSGRMLRLFNRGHLEEPRMIAALKLIGIQVWDKTAEGKQFRANFCSGHFGGSLDAILKGVPEMPDVAMLGEFKTHNEKSFSKLKTDGVHFVKWEHMVQMIMYMGAYGLTHALYVAVNKNTDELYAEIIAFDKITYDRYFKRGMDILAATEPPPRIHENPSWYKCKMCDFHGICHGKGKITVSCRTCKKASPMDGGGWHCGHDGSVRDPEAQKLACPHYQIIPQL